MALFGELLSNLNILHLCIPLGDAEESARGLGDCILFSTWETLLVGHSFLLQRRNLKVTFHLGLPMLLPCKTVKQIKL